MAATTPTEKLAIVLTHGPTGTDVSVDGFSFTRRLDTLASFQVQVQNPYYFNNGDIIRARFSRGSTATGYLYDWYGVVAVRNFRTRTITAYDYGAIMRQPITVGRNRFVGEDHALAIMSIIDEVDANGLIDTSQIHGNGLEKFITSEDSIAGRNESAWDMALRIVRSVVDDTHDGYVLPFHMYFDNSGKVLQIEKRQDIDDATNYPTITNAYYRDNLLSIEYRDRSDKIANKCTAIGSNGAEITVEDKNSTQVYSSTSLDFRTRHAVIAYDSPNTDVLQERAWESVMARRDAPADYDIDLIAGEAIRLNTILNVRGQEFGVDGRYVLTGFTTNGSGRTVLSVSGAKQTLADVI